MGQGLEVLLVTLVVVSSTEPPSESPVTDSSLGGGADGATPGVDTPGPHAEPPTSTRAGAHDSSRAKPRRIRSFLHRNRDDLIRDALVGGILAGVAFGGASWWDSRIAERQETLEVGRFAQQESLENTRFVRQVVIDGADSKPFRGLNLAGAQLPGLDLGCQAGNSGDLGCTDLAFADLTGADLSGTDLTGADLRGAILTDADLTGATLTDANLTGANLTGVTLTEAKHASAVSYPADTPLPRRAYLAGADLTRATLAGADLTRATLAGANLTLATLFAANLTAADLSSADLTAVDLTAAHLGSAILSSADLTAADLTAASLFGATLTGATLTDADLTGADLRSADFTGVDLTHAIVREICFDIDTQGQPCVLHSIRRPEPASPRLEERVPQPVEACQRAGI